MLQAILNNMLIVEDNIDDPTKIIINGSVSYISQIPWIQNATLKNNIILNKEYDKLKYEKTLELCELKNDLKSLVGGDMIEIGEKGINLSGGQKARVALARGVYCDTDIYIFDDPISALDSHVGQNIMNNVIVDHLKNKTRILVTHALQFLSYCDKIMVMSNGFIKWEGTYEELITKDFFKEYEIKLQKRNTSGENLMAENNIIEEENEIKPETEKKSKVNKSEDVVRITKEEDKEEGNVKFSVYLKYIKYSGGLSLFLLVFLSIIKIF